LTDAVDFESALALDAAGTHSQTVEANYRAAIAVNPGDVRAWAYLLNFLMTRGRSRETVQTWEEARTALAGALTHDPQAMLPALHYPIAAMALECVMLDFARIILDDITRVAPDTATLYSLENLYHAYRASQNDRNPFPLTVPYDRWWQGPHLFPGESGDWGAGRMWGCDDKDVWAMFGKLKDNQPVFYHLTLSWPQLKTWCPDHPDPIKEGQFFEVLWGDDPEAPPRMRFHPGGPWDDPNFPAVLLPKLRYLEARGLVIRSGD
jgi:hypothetical protein